MKLEGLLVVSFDGLNRAGKGTQIDFLKTHLELENYFVEVLRGDGSRPGNGSSNFYDPISSFWQQWQKIKGKSLADWSYAADVLAHENYLRCIEVINESKIRNQKGVVLFDRSHISRWYMLRKGDSTVDFERCLKEHTIHPDIYCFLDVPKEVLLTRNSDDDPTKDEFRKGNIITGYDFWVDTVEKVSQQMSIYRLDGTQNEIEIHNQVKKLVARNC